ncbi:MAG: hypothetical protein JOY80_04660, partial [Candidatus Dormibacteraeota bacterium]|nr:hypothetical protein [Candidatus Dormibacteraeota bacterium]
MRLLVGAVAVAAISVGIGGYTVHASAAPQSTGATNAQAGLLHPAQPFTVPAGAPVG